MNRRRSSDLPSDLSRLTLNASEATAKVEVPETLSLFFGDCRNFDGRGWLEGSRRRGSR